MRSNTSIVDKNQEKEICVLGLGFVGLTLSIVLADVGFKVYGLDVNQNQVDLVKAKKYPFYERGMDTYINRYVGNRLIPTSDISEIRADIYIISVGTPVDGKSKKPNTKFIESAVRSIQSIMKKGDLIILRSTIPVGLSRNLVKPILDESGLKAGEGYFLAFAPERTIEGDAITEIRELPQIVGGFDEESGLLAESLFKQVTSTVINVGDLESAEMIKLLNNTYRDVKFGYANEMALICKELGLDMVNLVKAANQGYPRDKIPLPSPGVGGACLTKDHYILESSCIGINSKPRVGHEARKANELVPKYLVDEMERDLNKLNKSIKNAKIFVVGFAFKGSPETSDLRGSTTLDLLAELQAKGASNINGYDFIVDSSEINKLGVKTVSVEDGFANADVIFIMNNHQGFTRLDILSLIQSAAPNCVFMDGWGLFEPTDILSINSASYMGIGSKYDAAS